MATNEFGETVDELTREQSLEDLRKWVEETNTAMAGLMMLLVLYRRLPAADSAPAGWDEISRARSELQPGLHRLGQLLMEHLARAPTLAETMEWLAQRFILSAHETIAYSKLPEFTFRFRWQDGRLRFFSKLDGSRFGITDFRHASMARLSTDLGLQEATAQGARLTERGREFVTEAFQ